MCRHVTRSRVTCYKYSITCQDDLLIVDNAQSHVTVFRPISEAARSWSDDNDLWPFKLQQLCYMTDHMTNLATKYEDPTTIVHELRVITVPIDFHWKCVRGHCSCAESSDPWEGVKNNYIFKIPDPDLPIKYATFIGMRRRLRAVYSRSVEC